MALEAEVEEEGGVEAVTEVEVDVASEEEEAEVSVDEVAAGEGVASAEEGEEVGVAGVSAEDRTQTMRLLEGVGPCGPAEVFPAATDINLIKYSIMGFLTSCIPAEANFVEL